MTDPVDTAPLLIDDEDESVVEPAAITAPLEALLLMATEPMPTAELAQAVRAPVALVERALAQRADPAEVAAFRRQNDWPWRFRECDPFRSIL